MISLRRFCHQTCRQTARRTSPAVAFPRPLAAGIVPRRSISTLKRKAQQAESGETGPAQEPDDESSDSPANWASVRQEYQLERAERPKRVLNAVAALALEIDSRGSRFVPVNRKDWIPQDQIDKWYKSILYNSHAKTQLRAALARRDEYEEKILQIVGFPYKTERENRRGLLYASVETDGKPLLFAGLRVAREIESRRPLEVTTSWGHHKRYAAKFKKQRLEEEDIKLLERALDKRRKAEKQIVTILGQKAFTAREVHKESLQKLGNYRPSRERDVAAEQIMNQTQDGERSRIPEPSAW